MSTESGKEKGETKGMLLCPFYFLLDNMLRCIGCVSSPRWSWRCVCGVSRGIQKTCPKRCGTQLAAEFEGTSLGGVEHLHFRARSARSEPPPTHPSHPVVDVQSAWSFLLHCTGGRANDLCRVVRPELVGRFILRSQRRLVGVPQGSSQ